MRLASQAPATRNAGGNIRVLCRSIDAHHNGVSLLGFTPSCASTKDSGVLLETAFDNFLSCLQNRLPKASKKRQSKCTKYIAWRIETTISDKTRQILKRINESLCHRIASSENIPILQILPRNYYLVRAERAFTCEGL